MWKFFLQSLSVQLEASGQPYWVDTLPKGSAWCINAVPVNYSPALRWCSQQWPIYTWFLESAITSLIIGLQSSVTHDFCVVLIQEHISATRKSFRLEFLLMNFFFFLKNFLCQQIKTANAAPASYSPPPLASYSPVLHSCIMSTKGQRAVKKYFVATASITARPGFCMLKHFVSAGPMTSSPQSDIVESAASTRPLPQCIFSIFAPTPPPPQRCFRVGGGGGLSKTGNTTDHILGLFRSV